MTSTYDGKVLNILNILIPESKTACNSVIVVTSRTDFSWLYDVSKEA